MTKPGGTLGLCLWGELCFDAPWEETVRHFEPDYTYPHAWTPDWLDQERLRTHIRAAGFTDVRARTTQSRFGFENPEQFVEYFFESKNPELMRAYQPWWDKGLEGVIRPMYERIVKKKFNSGKDFDVMEAFLFVARKN